MTTIITGADAAVARLEQLVAAGTPRRLVGVVGAPGAGKSTLADAVLARIPAASVVPMDGWHYADELLDALGRHERKGAPDTFDVAGYVAALARIRSGEDVVVPRFERSIEAAIAGAIAVPATSPLVLTEGNYLLLESGGWQHVAPLLDEIWYLDVDDELRRSRLVARHIDNGRTPDAARDWVETVDEPNARRIAATRDLADAVVRLD